MPHTLHLFRRDLRLKDNTSLRMPAPDATQHQQPLSVGFIFDPQQVRDTNKYKSLFALRFLCESLTQLANEVKKAGGAFNIWHGKPGTIIRHLLEKKHINALHINADYTPFSLDRDNELEKICHDHGASFCAHHDTLLTEPGTVKTGQGSPFKVFTPFYKAARQQPIPAPQKVSYSPLSANLLASAQTTIPDEVTAQYSNLPATTITSGRAAGLAILASLATHANYTAERDIPSIDGTTQLSAHHKFGTISIRETYHAAQKHLGSKAEPIIRQLYWRDFFTHLAVSFPQVFGHAFNSKYNAIAWQNDPVKFKKWCDGKTGFPIVDAGMRQLNTTGYMHNRTRMIVASFLTKDLHIDWRWGEQYFARTLVDYDPCVNNGSWQWAASTGADAQPYFRIFNPWLQQKRFDPDAVYIKKWVPELQGVRATALHTLDKKPLSIPNYPHPMVDHKDASTKAKELFASIAVSSSEIK